MRDYLLACRLVHRIGNTLFVHGGVHEHSIGTVPGRPPVEGVDAWSETLNHWYREQMGAFVAGALDARGVPEWERLIAYQAPVPGTRVNTASVVYGRMTNEYGHPARSPRAVIEALARAGLERLVVGHTPSGDSPSLLREGAFELLMADNSYGRVEGASRVFLRDDSVSVAGRVRLDDGREDGVHFRLAHGDLSVPTGRQLRDTGQWVKGPLDQGDWLLFRALPQFRVEQRAMSPEDLTRQALR